MSHTPPSPNEILSKTDHGDDMQKRLRYQSTYASIISLLMFQPDSIVEEVYCELHEDILVKFKNGKFAGIQVKTRNLDLGPLRLNDPEVQKSIIRFIKLELGFIDYFERFTIATNVGFSKEKNKNLRVLTELAISNPTELLKARSASKKWIKGIAKQANCTDQEVIDVLKKTKLIGNISSMEDIPIKLERELATISDLKSQTLGVLNNIAGQLILKHFNAASLGGSSSVSVLYILSKNPEKDEELSVIQGKKITKNCIDNIIRKANSQPISLFIKDGQGLDNFPNGSSRLEKKMDAGGISYENIQLVKDQIFSLENHAASWLYKYDSKQAAHQYDQIKLIVQNECQEAHDENMSTELYGQKMLIKVRERLRNRYGSEKPIFFDCQYDHLLGMAGVLTEECKIWWSNKFDIK